MERSQKTLRMHKDYNDAVYFVKAFVVLVTLTLIIEYEKNIRQPGQLVHDELIDIQKLAGKS